MYRIYIVEDDPVIAGAIAGHLEKWGFSAHVCGDFSAVTEEFARLSPELVLMDITLPYYDGFYWCKKLRELSAVPIVFISSAEDNMSIVMAVETGADDFIQKPFDLGVLTAKLQAILRRAYSYRAGAGITGFGGVFLNLGDTALSYGGKRIELTKNEFRIMALLFENAGSPVSRDAIMTKLWESDAYVDDNTLSVNIARLRKKLSDIGLSDFIATKKGLGYMIAPGGE